MSTKRVPVEPSDKQLMEMSVAMQQADKVDPWGKARAAYKAMFAAAPQEDGWQPIETAPPNKKVLVGWWREWPRKEWEWESAIAWRYSAGIDGKPIVGTESRHGYATHWAEAPAPPSKEGSDE